MKPSGDRTVRQRIVDRIYRAGLHGLGRLYERSPRFRHLAEGQIERMCLQSKTGVTDPKRLPPVEIANRILTLMVLLPPFGIASVPLFYTRWAVVSMIPWHFLVRGRQQAALRARSLLRRVESFV